MKILLVTSRYPWPPRRGDQMRAVQMLDFLSDEHEVTLLAPAPGKDQPPPPEGVPYRVELYRPGSAAIFSGLARAVVKRLPLQTGLFYQPDLGRCLRELAPQHDLGILQLVRLAIHVNDFGDTPIVVDLIDSLSLNFSLRADVDRPWMVPPLKIEARLLAVAERRLAERAAGMIVVCERDRQALANRLPPELAAKVSVVRLSVRERKVDPPLDNEKLWREGDKGPVLALTGNLGYFVNMDAVTWWLRDVWPQLRRVRPDVRLVVAGDRNTRRVDLREARVGEQRALPVGPPDCRGVAALGVGREKEGVAVATGAKHHSVAKMRLDRTGHHVPNDDASRPPVDHDHIEHLAARVHLHRAGRDLALECLVSAEQQLLAGLAPGVERARQLCPTEAARVYEPPVLAGERHTLGDALIDDVDAELSEAVHVGLAGAEVAPFDRVVEEPVEAVAVVLVVLGRVDAALGGNAVGSPRAVLVAERLYVVTEFTQGRGGGAAGQAGAHHDHGVLSLVGRVHQLEIEAVGVPQLLDTDALGFDIGREHGPSARRRLDPGLVGLCDGGQRHPL